MHKRKVLIKAFRRSYILVFRFFLVKRPRTKIMGYNEAEGFIPKGG
jgi:hypothetical protein